MKRNSIAKTFGLPAALILGLSLSASATVTMQFTWGGTYYQSGFTASSPLLPSGIAGNEAIGIYHFNTSGDSTVPNPLYSVCLSPSGLLDGNPHTYNSYTFAEAAPGIWPNAWAQSTGLNPQYWGINNAAYLWNLYGMAIVNNTGGVYTGNQDSAAAALQLAVWEVLYDSTGYGQLGGNRWNAPTLTSTTATYYNGFLTALTTSGLNHAIYTGNILESTIALTQDGQSGGGQEFFLLGTPVPEPTTMMAGALLLVPLGMSTLRILRRNRPA